MILSFEVQVNASRQAIWEQYTDVNKRAIWEEDLESLTFDGPLESGSTGKLKLRDMPEMNFLLTDIRVGEAYWDQTEVPGLGFIIFGHDILEKNGKLYLKHSVCLEKERMDDQDLNFLMGIFSDVPSSVLKIKSEVEK